MNGICILSRSVAAFLTAVLLAAPLPPTATAVVLDGDTPQRSWQLDGRVYAAVIVDDTVYVGGAFSQARSPSGEVVGRRNVAAFSMSTGELRRDFRADAGSSVRALATDGNSLYVGGHFGRVAGVNRSRLAKLDLATGEVDTRFRADADQGVLCLVVQDGWLYAGGVFQTVNGTARSRLVKVDPATGAVDPQFVARADSSVLALAKDPLRDVLYAGGRFGLLSGVGRTGVGGVSSTTGASVGPNFRDAVRPTLGLAITEDGSQLFGALAAGGNSARAWDTATGRRQWSHRADGDVQAIAYHDGEVFFGFHDGFQGDTSLRLLSTDAGTGTLREHFAPTFDRFWGVFAIAVAEEGLVAGGEFDRVSGVPAEGFVSFPGTPDDDGDGGTGPPPDPDVEFLGASTTWRYWDSDDLDAAWSRADLDDGGWATGRAELGYGDGDETTVISYGPSRADKHMTSYFRASFTVEEAPESLILRLLADDGAVAYLNGTEIVRDNMPSGPITGSTPAATGRWGGQESTARTFSVDPGLLVSGVNVLAVEVHQDRPSSSDLSMAADLVASYGP